MASAENFRPDRAILKRQRDEARFEKLLESNKSRYIAEEYAKWENKTADAIHDGRVAGKVKTLLEEHREAALDERRKKLSALLYWEKNAYEAELAELVKPNPEKMKLKMTQRALELKSVREAEKSQFVKEKLYQQWRESIDELRSQDAKLFELQVTHARGIQIDEKDERELQERRENAIFDAIWQEGYHAKVERENREKAMRGGLSDQVTATLDEQVRMKQEMLAAEAADEAIEAWEMKKHWAEAEIQAKEMVERNAAVGKEERRKVDLFRAIVDEENRRAEELEKLQDQQFVKSVLAKEKLLAEKEEADKLRGIEKVKEFTECLKKDMARKAAGDELLIQMQNDEQEKQWAKRFEQWEKEELARRALLEDVYKGRAAQILHKNEVRSNQRQNILDERALMDAEVQRLEDIDKERAKAEALLKKRHQEELFRQMDYHQVQRHRELQQHMIEQRQAMISEERFRQAKEAELEKQAKVKANIEWHNEVRKAELEARAAARKGVTAPWDK